VVSRRTLLGLAAGGAVAAAAHIAFGALRRLLAPAPEFEPIASLPGFRRLAGGPVSRGAPLFVGLGEPAERVVTSATLCRHLFTPRPEPGGVPIAYFSDYRCSNCRVVSPILAGIAERGVAPVTWHEWPILGESSRLAARAALAARRQGAYEAFHERMMGSSFLPTPAYIEEIARDAGIDPGRLRRDMDAPAVTRQLARSDALAGLLGFIGTPGLVIGRTAVMGRMDRDRIERLIAIERAEAAPNPCARG